MYGNIEASPTNWQTSLTEEGTGKSDMAVTLLLLGDKPSGIIT